VVNRNSTDFGNSVTSNKLCSAYISISSVTT